MSVLSNENDIERDEVDLIVPNENNKEYEKFILTPEIVHNLWDSSRPKNSLIEIFQAKFKPK